MHLPHPGGEFTFHQLAKGRALEAAGTEDHGVKLLSLADRGAVASLPADWTSIWIVLKGQALFTGAYVEVPARAGEMLAWSDGPIRAMTLRGSWLLGVAAPIRIWSELRGSADPAGRRSIFSRLSRTDREILRLVVRMVRGSSTQDATRMSHLQALRDAVRDHQIDLEPWLAKCSGQTRARKEYTLHRLIRARNVIIHSRGVRSSITELSSIARFSPTHFKRLYREVFGTTPGEHASQLKVEHTWNLITNTTLTLVDICDAVGFESKSAFCRTFKQHFGVTTTQARERLTQ